MNSETYEALQSIAAAAGAIGPCPDCETEDIYQDDSDADSRAYAMATNVWKEGGEPGLRGITTHKELSEAMKGVLDDATQECQTCNAHKRDNT